jgi:hypothetical protein
MCRSMAFLWLVSTIRRWSKHSNRFGKIMPLGCSRKLYNKFSKLPKGTPKTDFQPLDFNWTTSPGPLTHGWKHFWIQFQISKVIWFWNLYFFVYSSVSYTAFTEAILSKPPFLCECVVCLTYVWTTLYISNIESLGTAVAYWYSSGIIVQWCHIGSEVSLLLLSLVQGCQWNR